MTWDYWIRLYIETWCVARGLRPKTLVAYEMTLKMFRDYVKVRLDDKDPDAIVARDVLEYIEYLRREPAGDSHFLDFILVFWSDRHPIPGKSPDYARI